MLEHLYKFKLDFKLLAPALFVLAISGSTALALPAHASTLAQTNPQTTANNYPSPPAGQMGGGTEGRANAQTRLEAAKLKACQNREKAIDNIMARISDRGQKQLNLFTTIATRVENFYTKQGKTLSNYDTLVSAVNNQKAAAQTEVDTIKSDSVSFKCDGSDPRGVAQSFKGDLKSVISALQAYRTAVKNLIVGVAGVQSTTSPSSNTGTQGSQQ
ncbi:MAG TPA: hypothetical protein VFP35_02790 [Candidatus Saccharimonadales bacterium]|nr:hypothetical protein [Candidatus Saccharimonadales bacterium]